MGDNTPKESPMQEPESVDRVDVVVVGAGMVGAALALGLGRQGWTVALIEKTTPAPVSLESAPDLRVSAINTHSEGLLRSLGAWSAIEDCRLAPFARLSVWEVLSAAPLRSKERPVNEVCFDARALGLAQFGHIVENNVTQWALWQAVTGQSGIRCFCPDGLKTLRQHSDHVEVDLNGGASLKAALVVGADGAESQVRALARIGIHREQYSQQALVTTVVHEGPPQDMTWQAFTASGPRAYLPLPSIKGQSWASLVWYDSPMQIAALKRLPEPDFIKAVQSAFPERLPQLLSAPARASFPLAKMQAQAYFNGRVTLVGDAAHTVNPMAGQGVNLGFQDVACLLELLQPLREEAQPDPGQSQTLSHYQERRRPANQQMIWLMDLFYHTFSNSRLPLQLARNLGLFAAQRLPMGKELVARYAMGVSPLPDALTLTDLLSALPYPPTPAQVLAKLRPRKNPINSSS